MLRACSPEPTHQDCPRKSISTASEVRLSDMVPRDDHFAGLGIAFNFILGAQRQDTLDESSSSEPFSSSQLVPHTEGSMMPIPEEAESASGTDLYEVPPSPPEVTETVSVFYQVHLIETKSFHGHRVMASARSSQTPMISAARPKSPGKMQARLRNRHANPQRVLEVAESHRAYVPKSEALKDRASQSVDQELLQKNRSKLPRTRPQPQLRHLPQL
jgi:ribosomal protein S30